MTNKIGIIGAGNMGGTFYKILGEEFGYNHLFLCDKKNENLEKWNGNNKFTVDKITEFIEVVDIIFIAVKPQHFPILANQIKHINLKEKTIISIMAGISIANIKERIDVKKIVRTMPNLAIGNKKGVTGWVTYGPVNNSEIEEILSKTGMQIHLNSEDQIDAITAISGSGPAYFLLMTENLANAATKLGFKKEEANKLARQTLLGAASLLEHSLDSATELRKKITSEKGVTETAITIMKNNKLENILIDTTQAAYNKTKELNN